MVKAITSFETSDGKKFNNELDANAHEQYLEIDGAIAAYTEAAGLKAADATRAKRHISAYVAFMKSYKGPMTLPAEVEAA